MTPQLKNSIDRLWTEFWTGGITNPLTVIEQITYLIFLRLRDSEEARDEARQRRTGRPFERRFGPAEQGIRWSMLRELGSSEELLRRLREEAFPHLRRLGGFMGDAQLMIVAPRLAKTAVEQVDALPLTGGDDKGDVYEYLLSKLSTAGINGQFRTPRHVIRWMADAMEIGPEDRVADPACGTGGFLVAALERVVREASMDPEHPAGERLTPSQWDHLQSDMLHGFDFDVTMLRIAAMNLQLHGAPADGIKYQDALSASFGRDANMRDSSDAFSVVLANPPFKGALDSGDVASDLLRTVKTRKTELLFLALILRMLRTGGRSATIVPDGVLFGSSTAHRALRQHLVERHQLDGVVSLPAGVFKPYAGVSTAILLFTKGGATRDVFFFDVERDGFSLDDKRTPEPGYDDLPEALNAWRARHTRDLSDRTAKAFTVSADEIKANGYDLSVGRWRERQHEDAVHEDPLVILRRMRANTVAASRELKQLERMLG